MSKFQTHRINSELGVQVGIEYRNYDVKSYGCAVCGERDGYRENIREHIRGHDAREKMEEVAEAMGFDDDSRIDRFKKVQQMSQSQKIDELITVHKQKPPVSEEPKGEPGLDAAPSVVTNGG